ncbi:MAG: hypothetical protein HY868_01400 [Chloroflexi bacterium]|nr:hypothetical protein [Chloroflexota bacterium]
MDEKTMQSETETEKKNGSEPEEKKPTQLAFDLMHYLEAQHLKVNSQLREEILRLYKEAFEQDFKPTLFAEAIKCAREFYQLGLSASDSYAQGMACHFLGMIYFGLGNRGNDWDRALEQLQKSVFHFDPYSGEQRSHNLGVAWLSIAYVLEWQCRLLYRDRWQETIDAYRQAFSWFRAASDDLEKEADSGERRVTLKHTDWQKSRDHAHLLEHVAPAQKQSNKPTDDATEPQANATPIIDVPFAERWCDPFNWERAFKLIVFAEQVLLFIAAHVIFFALLRYIPELAIYAVPQNSLFD